MKIKKHFTYYIALIAILFVGLFAAFTASHDRQIQLNLILATAVSYSLLGILHHWIHHDLALKIMVEYILTGGLGVSIVLFLLKTL